MFDTLLVPTDGSEGARRAFGHAVAFARDHGATVHVLGVTEPRGARSDEARVQEVIDETVAGVPDDAASLTRAVRTGVPHEEILAYGREHGSDLLVLGTHGHTGVKRHLLGSTTEKVVRTADVPVLTVRSGTDAVVHYPYEHVLVPTDGSDGAAAAVGPAAEIAATCGARLHAVSVVDARAMATGIRPDLVLDELRARAREAVDDVVQTAGQRGVEHTRTDVQKGVPYRSLQSYIDEFGIDLVVMGTHGRRGIDRYLLGSVAERLVRTAPAPVMTVRYPEE